MWRLSGWYRRSWPQTETLYSLSANGHVCINGQPAIYREGASPENVMPPSQLLISISIVNAVFAKQSWQCGAAFLLRGLSSRLTLPRRETVWVAAESFVAEQYNKNAGISFLWRAANTQRKLARRNLFRFTTKLAACAWRLIGEISCVVWW